MKLFTSIIRTVAIGTLTASVGCAQHLVNLRGNERCISPCHDEVPRAVVSVGGQVHVPCQLEVGANGLLLRDALMSAGGSREPGQVQEMIFTPAAVDQLKRLDIAAVEYGKRKGTYDRSVDAETPQAREFIFNELGLTAEQLQLPLEQQKEAARAIVKSQEDSVNTLVDELTKSFELRDLQELKEFGRLVGSFDADLVLIDNPEVAEQIGSEKEELERLRAAQDQNRLALMKELLDRQGNTSLHNFPLQTELLVAVERRSAQPPATYYFPYSLAADGMASDIVLRGGDVVNVVDVNASDLIPPEPQPGVGNTVAIQGYLEEPGIAEGVAGIRNIRSFSNPTINDPLSVWTLVRQSPTGQLKVFVFPDRMIARNSPIADAPTQEGDIYTYTTLGQLPIVFESLLAGTMENAKRRCLDTLHERRQQHKEQCHSRLECCRDRVSDTLNFIPMPSVPCR